MLYFYYRHKFSRFNVPMMPAVIEPNIKMTDQSKWKPITVEIFAH